MKVHYIPVDSVSISKIRDGATQYRVLMNPQPKENAKFISFYVHDGEFHICDYNEGSVLGLREPWAETEEGIVYMADGYKGATKPSFQLKKEHVRFYAVIKKISAERLQGVKKRDLKKNLCADVDEFRDMWKETIKFKARTCKKYGVPYKWEDNPWVWVLDIERCEKPLE